MHRTGAMHRLDTRPRCISDKAGRMTNNSTIAGSTARSSALPSGPITQGQQTKRAQHYLN